MTTQLTGVAELLDRCEGKTTLPTLDESRRLLEIVGALFDCPSERAGWSLCLDMICELLGVRSAAALEFVETDRLAVRATRHVDAMTRGVVLPVAPGSQAAYARQSDRVVVCRDLVTENRFEASSALIESGFRSCLTAAVDLTEQNQVIFGAYSSEVDRFGPDDLAVFQSLAPVMAGALRRMQRWDRMQLSARTDLLTGLMNRSTILQRLTDLLDSRSTPTTMLIDLDGFKAVNDEQGHRAGDAVLREIASRLERGLEPGQDVGRLGGDEFLVVIADDAADAPIIAQRLIGHIEEVVMTNSTVVQLSASIGIARTRVGDDATSLIERADRLMYEAKSVGRGEIRIDADVDTTPTDRASAPAPPPLPVGRVTLDGVTSAIDNLRIVVQPIVDPSTQQIRGVEALTRGPVGHQLEFPDRLFTAATTYGYVAELELASKRLAFDLELDEDVELYVNLEPVLLCDEGWMAQLTNIWKSSRRRQKLTVELTERAVLVSPGRLLQSVEVCRNLGWKIALDDVGSRSESLAALRWISPDVVKLDMSLIANSNPDHTAHVVSAVAAYRDRARGRPVMVIAEGVETDEDAQRADVLGADLVQGYLYGRPGPLTDLQLTTGDVVASSGSVPHRVRGQRVTNKRELLALTRRVESAALSSDCVLVASIQHVRHLSHQTRCQYEGIARRCGFVGLIGEGLSTMDGAHIHGVRIADLSPDDPLRHNWEVVALSPAASFGLSATELEPNWEALGIPDMDRLFSYRILADDQDVELLARRLLRYF